MEINKLPQRVLALHQQLTGIANKYEGCSRSALIPVTIRSCSHKDAHLRLALACLRRFPLLQGACEISELWNFFLSGFFSFECFHGLGLQHCRFFKGLRR